MTVIKIKNSNVSGRLPASGDIETAELALNIADKKLYSKDASGAIFEIGVAGDLPSGLNPPSSGNNIGDLFYDTTEGNLVYWDGSAWIPIVGDEDGEGYVKVSGSNMTGDLTLGTDKITLDATTGSATFASDIRIGGTLPASPNIALYSNGKAEFHDRATNLNQWRSTFDAGAGFFHFADRSDHVIDDLATLDLGTTGFLTRNAAGVSGALSSLQLQAQSDSAVTRVSLIGYSPVGVTGNTASFGICQGQQNALRFNLNENGDVGIGGTLPASPNISLNADGSASFSDGNISLNADGSAAFNLTESRTYDPTNVTFAGHAVNVSDTSGSGWSGFRLIADSSNGVNTSASIQAVKNSNNRSDFTIATYGVGGSQERLRIDDSGDVLIGGTLPASPNISLNAADGSATFAGGVQSGFHGIAINNEGSSVSNEAFAVSSAPGNDSYTRKITFKTDGSASFADGVGAKYLVADNVTGAGSLAVSIRAGGTEWVRVRGDKQINIGGDPSSPVTSEINLNGNDGSASFSEYIQVAKSVAGGALSFSVGADMGGGSYPIEFTANGFATFIGTVTANGTVLTSDARFKENITPAKPQLADVVALGGLLKNYDWNEDSLVNDELRSVRQLGLIAQEAAKVCPAIVKDIKRTKTVEVTPAVKGPKGAVIKEAVTKEEDDSYKGISQDALIMKLIGAVAELSAEVTALKAVKTTKK